MAVVCRFLYLTPTARHLWRKNLQGIVREGRHLVDIRPAADQPLSELAYGYSEDLLTNVPRVRRNSADAIAGAFRAAQLVKSAGQATGVSVSPLLTSSGCVGVPAL